MVEFGNTSAAPMAVRVFLFACIVFFLTPSVSFAQFSDDSINVSVSEEVLHGSVFKKFSFEEPVKTPLVYELHVQSEGVKDEYKHSGMAVYLGMAPAVKVSENGRVSMIKFKDGAAVPNSEDWIGYKGRFKAVLARSETAAVSLTPQVMTLTWPAGVTPDLTILTGRIDSTAKHSTAKLSTDGVVDMRTLKYAHLPRWMRILCRLVEGIYKGIQSVTGLRWGVSLLLFAILMKLILLPISRLTTRFQNQANAHKTALEPIFEDIKKNFKGETAHNKVMAAYKARGITPYYSLKPMLATLISLPVLIAIFNMLGELEPLTSAGWLWAESLAYPDAVVQTASRLPLFGNSLNLLPFIMAGVTFVSAYTLKSSTASPREISRQKRNLFLMGMAFFVIFYPFPSAMVLYWTLSSAVQLLISKFIKSA